jgi:hypothetical protein
MLMEENATMDTHSHVRERTSRQPRERSAKNVCRGARSCEPTGSKEEDSADDEGDAVDSEHPSGAEEGDQHAGDRRADDVEDAAGDADQRVRVLEMLARHELRDQPLRRGLEEGRRCAEERGGDHEQRHRHRVLDEQRCGEEFDGRADRVAGEHHEAARQPVRPDPACERERRPEEPEGAEHVAEVGRRADLQHCEDEREVDERVADAGSRLAKPEQPEWALAERAEVLAWPHG